MGKSRAILTVLLVFFMIAIGHHANATHLRAGEIIVERVSCQSLTFRITILVYADTESGVKFGDGILRLGDGSDPDNDEKPGFVIDTQEYTLRPDLGENIATASYTWEHTYGAPGKYIISYFENNRNDGILNMNNSVNTPFFVEAEINIDPFLGCNNSPVLLIPPIDIACPGVAFFHNPGAFDPDGDSLSFELVVPKKDVGTTVDNYRFPNVQEFFADLPFENEDGTNTPEFEIDPRTGELKWDAPGDIGRPDGREYNVAFRILEWRKIGDEWFNLGYVIRDMQILVIDCENDRPGLIVPEDICVEAGTFIDETILGIDPDFDEVTIEAFSEVFDSNSNSADYDPKNVFQSTLPPNDTANVQFTWQTDCFHVRDQPYQVVFKITDRPPNGPKLVEFETWNITVIAPAPDITDAQIDFPNRSVDLEWDSYECQNAESIQVWRRVDSFNYVPGECETGGPDFLGYDLIASLNPSNTTYTDNNGGLDLNFGAAYCYRLVAVFRQPSGGESIMSAEICVPPVKADAPVVTHVTVDETDRNTGEVTVSWTPPFEIDEAQFGTDYVYELERSEGLIGSNFTKIGTTADTTFTDTGLNTHENSYTYRIVLYSNNATIVSPDIPIITSAEASTVYLTPRPLFEQIELFWIAEVPWSNNSQDYPWHYIYRKLEEEPNDQFVLIDSVNVNTFGFTYIDKGDFNDEPLVDNQIYCYYVTTQGTYGNPAIIEPLINDSQIVCAQPSDDIAPCTPLVTVEGQSCEEFIANQGCEFNQFENALHWSSFQGEGCQDDIARYDIYYSVTPGGEFEFLASTTDTVFVDENLVSFARCYKIRAVDLSGNVSEFSDEICFDNCPYYELPNVFTPGNSDGCNDLFSAFSNRPDQGLSCGGVDPSKCARFVKAVSFKVMNRWGKLVYEYESGGENSIYIDWDGKDLDGRDLAAGTYFYLARVTFDVVDPDERVQDIKGWVQILR